MYTHTHIYIHIYIYLYTPWAYRAENTSWYTTLNFPKSSVVQGLEPVLTRLTRFIICSNTVILGLATERAATGMFWNSPSCDAHWCQTAQYLLTS